MAKRKSPKQRKEERQQEKQRGQQRIFIGVAVIVAIFAAIIFALTSLPADAELPTGLDRYEDFMTSTTDEGYAVLGNPNAPVTVREYSSFSCPGCMDFHRTTFSQLLPAIENGAVKFVFIPLQTGSIANPEGAARTAICAGEQGMFWEMHDVLFFWQETYGTTAFQDSRIRTGVQELGLNTSAFNSCFRSNATSTVLTAAQGEGVGSTPSIEVNGILLPDTSFETISEAITNNLGTQTSFPSGLISGASEETETDDVESTEEAVEVTEEAEMDDMEATEEAEIDDMEATEEAEMDDAEATEEAE